MTRRHLTRRGRQALASLSLLLLAVSAGPAKPAPSSTPAALPADTSAAQDLPTCQPSAALPCLAPNPGAEALRRGTGGNLIGIFWSGPAEVTIASRMPGPLRLCCIARGALSPVAGGDYQAITVRLASRDVAPFDLVLQAHGRPLLKQSWPRKPTVSALSAGRYEERELASPDGRTRRRISLYVPEGYAADPHRRAVVLADGQGLGPFASDIDAAIAGGRLPKTLLVGVWSDPEHRSGEYVPSMDPARYQAHAAFVTGSVLPFAETTYGAPHRWVVAGMSDGAAWAISTALSDPRRFAASLALAPVYGPVADLFRRRSGGPIFVGWGSDDPPARAVADRLASLDRASVTLCRREVPGGHGSDAWRPLFIQGLTWVFVNNLKCQS